MPNAAGILSGISDTRKGGRRRHERACIQGGWRYAFGGIPPLPPPMRRTLLTVLLLLTAGLGGSLYWMRAREGEPNPEPGQRAPDARASDLESKSREPLEADRTTRVDLSPTPESAPAPVVAEAPEQVPAHSEPKAGAGVDAIFGGNAAFEDFYAKVSGDDRKARLEQLDAALDGYLGDPVERGEFEKYVALKTEAEWLRVHSDG
ncbi:MAG: hypothetical protein IPJ19_09430 [Planctomycetes bacterium]|nr:hypothetical protein [Planctomycetota bacterium]